MAEKALQIPTTYIPDPTSGRPISSGDVYIGVADTDSEILANRISVVIIQENGIRVPIAPASQPLKTLGGGVIEYQGSPVTVLVDGVYSLKILDSLGAQKYYVPRANETATTQANEGVAPVNGSFEFDTQTTGQADNWTALPGTNGTIAIDTDSAHGPKSLKFTGADATGGGTETSDKFDVLAGDNVSVTYTYKSTAIDTLNKIDINWYSSADALISTGSILNEGAANPLVFTSDTGSVTAPATAVRAEIVLTGVDGTGTTVAGSTFFDNILYESNTHKTLTSPVINGKPAYGLVVLDVPEILHIGTPVAANTWYSSSTGSEGNTTLSDNSAVKAILRVDVTRIATGTSNTLTAWIRKGGESALTFSNNRARILYNKIQVNSSVSIALEGLAESLVNLDGSSDFDFAVGVSSTSIRIYLVGYYV